MDDPCATVCYGVSVSLICEVESVRSNCDAGYCLLFSPTYRSSVRRFWQSDDISLCINRSRFCYGSKCLSRNSYGQTGLRPWKHWLLVELKADWLVRKEKDRKLDQRKRPRSRVFKASCPNNNPCAFTGIRRHKELGASTSEVLLSVWDKPMTMRPLITPQVC